MDGTNIVIIMGIAVLSLFSGGQAQVQSFCKPELCRPEETHIACNNDGRFASTCPPGAQLVPLDNAARAGVVAAHNEVRQKWSSGNGNFRAPACRMATMSWNDELAQLAELLVKRCEMKHDQCRNTDTFHKSGQNLSRFKYPYESAIPDPGTILRNAVKYWANEGRYLKPEHLKAYPEKYNGPDIGHITEMTHERNVAVGCAISKYEKDDLINVLVACNYGTSIMPTQPVYTFCSRGATKCTTGTNPQYPDLCSISEKFDYNYREMFG